MEPVIDLLLCTVGDECTAPLPGHSIQSAVNIEHFTLFPTCKFQWLQSYNNGKLEPTTLPSTTTTCTPELKCTYER